LLSSLLIASPLAFGYSFVLAQDKPDIPDTPKPPATLPKVEITGNTDTDAARLSTTSKAIVTRAEIEKYGDTQLSEVLKRLPGVSISGRPGRGLEVQVRGLGQGYAQLLINGEPAGAGFSIDQIAPSAIERIEINRVGTADQSAQAIAGSINTVLKQIARSAHSDLKLAIGSHSGEPVRFFELNTSDKRGIFSYNVLLNVRSEYTPYEIELRQRGFNNLGVSNYQLENVKTEFYNDKAISIVPRLN
jgi:outer membrane receptor for ferrienterochelin and colicins